MQDRLINLSILLYTNLFGFVKTLYFLYSFEVVSSLILLLPVCLTAKPSGFLTTVRNYTWYLNPVKGFA